MRIKLALTTLAVTSCYKPIAQQRKWGKILSVIVLNAINTHWMLITVIDPRKLL